MSKFSGFGLIVLATLAGISYASGIFAQSEAQPIKIPYTNAVQAPLRPNAPPPAPVPDVGVVPVTGNTDKVSPPSLATIVNEAPQAMDRVIVKKDDEQAAQDADKKQDARPTPVDIATIPTKKPSHSEVIYRVNLGRADDVALLIKQGASVDETNSAGVPLISLAASRSDSEGLEVVKVLVEAGADINKTDNRGQNALFYAAKIGNKEVVKYLLSEKIRYTALDSTGNNARIIAYQTGHNEIIEILDNFVRQQNNEVRQQYAQVNKELQERYNAYNAVVQQQINLNNAAIFQKKYDRVQELVHDLSFASCAAAYWKFCNDNKQNTELGTANLKNNIKSQNSALTDISSTLISEQHIAPNSFKNVVSGSAEQIVKKLSELSTNEARSQVGVGTIDDMKKRCNSIADSWNATNVMSPK